MGSRQMSPPAAGWPVDPLQLRRRRPRSYTEWKALKSWGRLLTWEVSAPGFELRRAREEAGLTQAALAGRLEVTQQAVARAEGWESNPTVALIEAWATAVGGRVVLAIELPQRAPED